MTDGWENNFDCLFRGPAEAAGYRRVFNKASVKNWGTKNFPCPTLNLEASQGSLCVGIAFEFPDEQATAIEEYLKQREGAGFDFHLTPINVRDRGHAQALISFYTGKNLTALTVAEQAAAARTARGTSGSCSDYVMNISKLLATLEIEDPAVTELQKLLTAGNRS